MLRLEREKSQRKIVVRIRKRDRFLTRGFLVSLTIALLLHGTAFFVFHVSFSGYLGSQSTPPPVTIFASIDEGGTQALSDIGEYSHLRLHDLEPKIHPPALPQPLLELEKEGDALAHEIFPLYPTPPSLPTVLLLPSVQVEISGPLSAVNPPATPYDPVAATAPASYTAVNYEVRVDMQSGAIFWIRPLGAAPSKKWEKAAHNLLKTLEFHDPSYEGIISGTIRIAFLE